MNRLDILLNLYKEDPKDAFTIYGIGLEYQVFDKNEAKHYFDLLLKNNPEYLATYYQAGKLYEKLNDSEKAIEIYKEGIKYAVSKNDKHTQSELQGALLHLNSKDDNNEDDW